jgi:hypothetical protein
MVLKKLVSVANGFIHVHLFENVLSQPSRILAVFLVRADQKFFLVMNHGTPFLILVDVACLD